MENKLQSKVEKRSKADRLYLILKGAIVTLGFAVLMLLVLTTLLRREFIAAYSEWPYVHKNKIGRAHV